MPLLSAGATLLGLAFLTLASIYFSTPAGALPPFLPGHALGVSALRPELGLGTGIVSLFAFAIGWVTRLRHLH